MLYIVEFTCAEAFEKKQITSDTSELCHFEHFCLYVKLECEKMKNAYVKKQFQLTFLFVSSDSNPLVKRSQSHVHVFIRWNFICANFHLYVKTVNYSSKCPVHIWHIFFPHVKIFSSFIELIHLLLTRQRSKLSLLMLMLLDYWVINQTKINQERKKIK